MPHSLQLNDAERAIISAAAQPIDEVHRPAFFQAVVDALTPYAVLGEGLVHRVARAEQRRFIAPPTTHELIGSKYSHGVV
jgi:hypothetical protein